MSRFALRGKAQYTKLSNNVIDIANARLSPAQAPKIDARSISLSYCDSMPGFQQR
jgi:hypothetical protein